MGKIFVLDTSVLLFDHNSINNFEENDIVIPITVLEELDNFKIGNETKNFEARAVIRMLDKLSSTSNLNKWIKLGPNKGRLKIGMQSASLSKDAEKIYGAGKNDHKIINVAISLHKKNSKRQIILVTKDINLRIKAKAIGLDSEDYLTGKVEDIENIRESFPSIADLDATIISTLYQKNAISENGILKELKIPNGYYVLNNCTQSVLARYNGRTDQIERVEKKYAYRIKPKNDEQTFAMDALLNEDIKLVAIQGVAGTGKNPTCVGCCHRTKSLLRTDSCI